jgi:hypothetical protein
MDLTINGIAPDEIDSLDEGERTHVEKQKARDLDVPNPKPRKKNTDAAAPSTGRKGKNKTKRNKKKAEGSSKEDQESPLLPEGVQGCDDQPCECPFSLYFMAPIKFHSTAASSTEGQPPTAQVPLCDSIMGMNLAPHEAEAGRLLIYFQRDDAHFLE